MQFHEIKLRQHRVYTLGGDEKHGSIAHPQIDNYMRSNGYTDANRAYILNIGESNINANGNKFYKVSVPYPKAKDYRAMMIIPKEQVFEANCLTLFDDKCYDIDLGQRNKSRKLTYTDKDGKRCEEYVTASAIEKYMNFTDYAYRHGLEMFNPDEYSTIGGDSQANIATTIRDLYEKEGCTPFPFLMLSNIRYIENDDAIADRTVDFINKYNDGKGNFKETELFEENVKMRPLIKEAVEHSDKIFPAIKSVNDDTYAMYRMAMAKGVSDGICHSLNCMYRRAFAPKEPQNEHMVAIPGMRGGLHQSRRKSPFEDLIEDPLRYVNGNCYYMSRENKDKVEKAVCDMRIKGFNVGSKEYNDIKARLNALQSNASHGAAGAGNSLVPMPADDEMPFF